jgi:hypothetical protein
MTRDLRLLQLTFRPSSVAHHLSPARRQSQVACRKSQIFITLISKISYVQEPRQKTAYPQDEATKGRQASLNMEYCDHDTRPCYIVLFFCSLAHL